MFLNEQKTFQWEQKMFANKICSKSSKKSCKRNEKCWQWKSWDLAWPWVTYCGLVWPFTVFHNLHWHFIAFLWSCIAFLWSSMAKYGFDWTWIIFSRGHRSKFIWSWSTIQMQFQSFFVRYENRSCKRKPLQCAKDFSYHQSVQHWIFISWTSRYGWSFEILHRKSFSMSFQFFEAIISICKVSH